MPHLDEHLTFPIDKLSIQAVDYNSESPQDTVYVVPVTIHAEQGYGAELEGIGDGANVEVYLSLRYKFGIWDDELGQYRNIEEIQSDVGNNGEINQDNEITFGKQQGPPFGSVTVDLGGAQTSPKTRNIRIPTAREIYDYYGFTSVGGVDLIECEILNVYVKGNFREARIRLDINGLNYPSMPDTNNPSENSLDVSTRPFWNVGQLDGGINDGVQQYRYFKEKYSAGNFPEGHISKVDLPIGPNQIIGSISMGAPVDGTNQYEEGDNILRGGLADSMIVNGELPPSILNQTQFNALTLNFTEETPSINFDIPNVTIEQTLSQSYDAYSGMNINTSSFQNTIQGIVDSNEDGRVELGLFIFDDENLNSENFPITFRKSIFNQGVKLNLLKNGDCKNVEKNYQFRNTETYESSNVIKPTGGWKFLNFDGVGFKRENLSGIGKGGASTSYGAELTVQTASNYLTELQENYVQNLDIGGQSTIFEQTPQGNFGYGGYLPYTTFEDIGLNRYYLLLDKADWESVLVNGNYSPSNDDDMEFDLPVDNFDDSYTFGTSNVTILGVPPVIASWIRTDKAYSNNKCLVFHSLNPWGDYQTLDFHKFFYGFTTAGQLSLPLGLESHDGSNPEDGVVIEPVNDEYKKYTKNQYRVLNQSQLIHRQNEQLLNPFSSLKVKFKMYTDRATDLNNAGMPQVEVGVFLTDFLQPTGLGYQTETTRYQNSQMSTIVPNLIGGFNSKSHYNASNFNDKKTDRLGSMIRVENSDVDTWESFEFNFNFSLGQSIQSQISIALGSAEDPFVEGLGPGDSAPSFTTRKDITIVWSYEDLQVDDINMPYVTYVITGPTDGPYIYDQIPGIYSITEVSDDTTPLYTESDINPPLNVDEADGGQIGNSTFTGTLQTLKQGREYIFRINCGYVVSTGIGKGGFSYNYIFQGEGVEWQQTVNYQPGLEEVIEGNLQDLLFVVQSGNDFRGRVLLDDFEVYESYEFFPDVDVRKKISTGVYGKADLTKYYDKELQPDEYKDSTAPLEVQFYFYPTYPTDKIFDVTRTPMYEDFKKGLFYIYDVNWGDGSPNEFVNEPEQVNEEKALYHTYENSGIFEITGYMMRLKPNKLGEPESLIHNKKFRLRININEGLDEEFNYFGPSGFSFIPYKNTLPIIGGISKQSIYYKSIKRLLGFLDDGQKTKVSFKSKGDRLKTELALLKMENQNSADLEILPPYLIQRNLENNTSSPIIYNGITPIKEELGKGIGDCDLTNIKYYNKPTSIWEMFGFEEEDLNLIGKPDEPRYWKNIIPQDYSIFNREGITNESNNPILQNTTTTSDIKLYIFAPDEDGYVPIYYTSNEDLTQIQLYGLPLSDDFGGEAYHNVDMGDDTLDYQNGEFPSMKVLSFHTGDGQTNNGMLMTAGDYQVSRAHVNPENNNDSQQNFRHGLSRIQEGVTDVPHVFPRTDLPKLLMKIRFRHRAPIDYSSGEPINLPEEQYIAYQDRWLPADFISDMPQVGEFYVYNHITQLATGIEPGPDFPAYLTYDSNGVVIDGGTDMNGLFNTITFDNNTGQSYIAYFHPNQYSPGIFEIEVEEDDDEVEETDVEDDNNNNDSTPPTLNTFINIYANQDWIDVNENLGFGHKYYYPVLPKYGADGRFVDVEIDDGGDVIGGYPKLNGSFKTPFSLEGSITNEDGIDAQFTITNDKIESSVLNDKVGNENLGHVISDYKPTFNDDTLKPNKRTMFDTIRTNTKNGAF